MSEKLRLEVVTPYGSIVNEEVDEVVAPGSEGEFGVLPGHVPFVTTLKIGVLTYKQADSTRYVFINSGYAEVSSARVLVLADSAEKAEEIDVERARASIGRAEERLKKKAEFDFRQAEVSLERAVTRIQVTEKHSR
jgi:F-type H+-transporting ATPase subunit epsilon